MIVMRRGIGEKKVLQTEASSAVGDGTFYLTDRAVAYEVRSKGIYLDFIPHDIIKDLRVSGSSMFGTRKMRLVWTEGDDDHSFEIRTRQYRQILDEFQRLRP